MRARTAGVIALALSVASLGTPSPAASIPFGRDHDVARWRALAGAPAGRSLPLTAGAGASAHASGRIAPLSVPDGSGGLYIAWADGRDGAADVYLQHVTNTGAVEAGWPADGLTVCDAPGSQVEPVIMPDGSNGVIVAWLDFRNDDSPFDPDGYAQRFTSTGTRLWGINGLKVIANMSSVNAAVAPDGTGGIVVGWTAMGASDVDVYSLRIDGTGNVATGWSAAGNLVCDATGDQANADIAPDGSGGAVLSWEDTRNGTTHLYAQRMNSAGVAQWAANGIQIDASASGITQGGLVSDGGTGAGAFWVDVGAIGDKALAQYLNSAGTAQWTAGGIPVPGSSTLNTHIGAVANSSSWVLYWDEVPGGINSVRGQRLDWTGAAQWGAPGVSVVSVAFATPNITDVVLESGGNAYFLWEDSRGAPSSQINVPDIYAQRITAAGVTSWTANGLAVSMNAGGQYMPTGAPDGSGGLLLAWVDQIEYDPDIYAQRLNSAGVAQFLANGIPVYSNPGVQIGDRVIATNDGGALVFYNQKQGGNYNIRARKVDATGAGVGSSTSICSAINHQILSAAIDDGSGGAIVVWLDYRSGVAGDIYAQRVDINGTPLWTADGVPICTAARLQSPPSMVSDGLGGAILAWQDNRNAGNSDIYAQRIDASGTVQWAANGVAVCNEASSQKGAVIASDGANGAIVAWEDSRTFLSPAIYAQRLNSAGVAQWTANGLAIATFSYTSSPSVSDAVSGASNDAIVLINETKINSITGNITTALRAQKVDGSGTPQWGSLGTVVCDVSFWLTREHIVDDGAGGAYVGWSDARTLIYDIYLQLLNSAGTPQWTANGQVICNAIDAQLLAGLTRDSGGDAYLTWYDERNSFSDIYAQRVNNAGTAQWTANGVQVCGAPRGQYFASIAPWKSASPPREFIAWTDNRAGDQRFIYMQRLDGSGVGLWTSDGIVGTTLAMVSATADQDRVRVQWFSPATIAATVERRTTQGEWQPVGSVTSDGTGMITFEDRDITPGARYGYRLSYVNQGQQAFAGEVWVDVPGSLSLAIEGVRPNPAVGAPVVWFTLPGTDPAKLELIDIAGRQVYAQELSGLPAGRQALRLDRAVPASGLYFFRLTQDGRSVSARATFLK